MLAQADPNIPEMTAGAALATTLLVSAVTGSLMVLLIWLLRWREGRSVIPIAVRKPLIVPLPLLVMGLLLGLMMSLSARDGRQPNHQVEPDETDVVEAETESDGGATSGNQDRSRFMSLILGTLSVNLMILTAFGIVIAMCQQNRSRKVSDPADVAYGRTVTESQISPTGADIHTPSDAMPNEYQPISHHSNPYAVSATPPNPFIEDSLHTTDNPEPWIFIQELRFAAEAVLAAYVPTAAIRLLIVALQPEAPSHPFFEVIQSGVDWLLMALIGVMAVIVAPVVEEMLYRVTIMGGLMQQKAGGLGLIGSSVLFAFAHGFPDSIALLPLSLAIGYTYMCRRSYRTVILVHMLFNGFNMALAGLAQL